MCYLSDNCPVPPVCSVQHTQAFAEALLGLAKALAENSGHDAQETIIKLQVRTGVVWGVWCRARTSLAGSASAGFAAYERMAIGQYGARGSSLHAPSGGSSGTGRLWALGAAARRCTAPSFFGMRA